MINRVSAHPCCCLEFLHWSQRDYDCGVWGFLFNRTSIPALEPHFCFRCVRILWHPLQGLVIHHGNPLKILWKCWKAPKTDCCCDKTMWIMGFTGVMNPFWCNQVKFPEYNKKQLFFRELSTGASVCAAILSAIWFNDTIWVWGPNKHHLKLISHKCTLCPCL